MSIEIHAEIDIDAPPAVVWEVLTDFPRYARWNPFIVDVRGEPRAGESVEVTVALPGQERRVFRTRVTHASAAGELTWVGRLPIPGLLDGEHSFVVAPRRDSEGTRFIQHESFSGVLLAFVSDAEDTVRAGFHAMNRALKAEAERRALPVAA
jgi:hypothetical protein